MLVAAICRGRLVCRIAADSSAICRFSIYPSESMPLGRRYNPAMYRSRAAARRTHPLSVLTEDEGQVLPAAHSSVHHLDNDRGTVARAEHRCDLEHRVA